jgi:hypothetical protein
MAKPKNVILNKNKDTRESTKIGATYPNQYGGENITFSLYDSAAKKTYKAIKIVYEGGQEVQLGWTDLREYREPKQRMNTDGQDTIEDDL